MKYLWDTDICVYFMNGNDRIADRVKTVGAGHICMSILSIAELKYGAHNSTRVENNLNRIHELQRSIVILRDMTDEITNVFGRNKALLRSKGIVVGDMDLLVAAFASANDLTLVTNNRSHFEAIPGLRMENWFV